MSLRKPDDKATTDLIAKLWHGLKRPPVDARVLRTIQKGVREQLGTTGALSPALIARILADEGAELRHPEIIECDVAWRQSMLDDAIIEFAQVQRLLSGELLSLGAAEELIEHLEILRQKFEGEDAQDALTRLKTVAVQARQAAQSIAGNHGADEQLRLTQAEISEWLKVWLQTPTLFRDWLELRRRTEEFRRKFH
jgi:hypothetical protein